MTENVRISNAITIPLSDIRFRYSRSGGPGGQHVNTSDTKVTLTYDIANAADIREALGDSKFEKLLNHLRNITNKQGILQISCQETRSQLRNKEIVIDQFRKLIKQALIEPKVRKKTKPSKTAKQRRLNDKKKRSEVKAGRRKNWG
ncbi:MAG: alternative ribosome rescue aminoacyl-tRNA hydrolase ArfB [Chloroflexota bacterium]